MKRRTIQLIQLFFMVFAVYSVFHFSGSQQKFIALFCLLAAYGLERLNAKTVTKVDVKSNVKTSKEEVKGKDAVVDNLNCLLKSRNPLVIADAVQYLLHDLGLLVAKAPPNQVISRFIKSSGRDGSIGLFILLDASELKEDWNKWEAITQFKKKQGLRYSTMILWSNCIETEAGKMKFRNFPTGTKKVLANKNVVALSTYTFYLLYSMCKTGKLDIHETWGRIINHPGGVVTLKK